MKVCYCVDLYLDRGLGVHEKHHREVDSIMWVQQSGDKEAGEMYGLSVDGK